jgi:hypothetical protein
MWIATNQGFLSIVQHRQDPNTLLVRARTREHLEACIQAATGVDVERSLRAVQETKHSDYRWRVLMSRAEAGRIVQAAFDAIDYPNFKNSVRCPRLSKAYNEVWNALANAFGSYGYLPRHLTQKGK